MILNGKQLDVVHIGTVSFPFFNSSIQNICVFFVLSLFPIQ